MNTTETLDWQNWGMCGQETTLPNGKKLLLSTWSNGDQSRGGFTLTMDFHTWQFTSRADAYAAAELLSSGLA